MRSLFSKTLLACFASASLAVLPLAAFWGGYDDCCAPACCEDGPLTCGAWGVQVKGGVDPTIYSNRENTYLTNPALLPPVFAGGSASFSNQFNCPWQVGAELTWNASTHVQFFTEYAYQQASGKRRTFTAGGDEFFQNFSDYKANNLFFGARYYFNTCWSDCCWGSIAPFAGLKGGIVWQDTVNYGFAFDDAILPSAPYYHRQTGVGAGIQIGIDWSICNNWGIVLTSEFVGTQGLRANRNRVLETATPGGVTNVSFGNTGTLLAFPVTLGVRYTF